MAGLVSRPNPIYNPRRVVYEGSPSLYNPPGIIDALEGEEGIGYEGFCGSSE